MRGAFFAHAAEVVAATNTFSRAAYQSHRVNPRLRMRPMSASG